MHMCSNDNCRRVRRMPDVIGLCNRKLSGKLLYKRFHPRSFALQLRKRTEQDAAGLFKNAHLLHLAEKSNHLRL